VGGALRIWALTSASISAWASTRTPSRKKSTSALSALRSNSNNSMVVTAIAAVLSTC
jgi:hypothetical protein